MHVSRSLRLIAVSAFFAFVGWSNVASAECVMCGIGRCYLRDGNGFENCSIDQSDGASVCSGNCYKKPKDCYDPGDPSCSEFGMSSKLPTELAALKKSKPHGESLMCASFERKFSSSNARIVKARNPSGDFTSEAEVDSLTANLVGAAVLKLTKLSAKSIAEVGQFSFGVPQNEAEVSQLKRGEAIRLDTASDAKIGIAVYRLVESHPELAKVEMNTWLFTKQSRVVFESARLLITYTKAGDAWAPRSFTNLGVAPELDAKKLLE